MTEPTLSAATRVHPPHGTVVACETGASLYCLDIMAGRHRLHADEPVDVGGGDTGPNPYELLSAALASCTTMTLRMYAERKGWNLGALSVAVRHEKIHAEDCAGCETRASRIDRFERVIEIGDEADDAMRAKLLEIADKCPVHRTLFSAVEVTTRLVGG